MLSSLLFAFYDLAGLAYFRIIFLFFIATLLPSRYDPLFCNHVVCARILPFLNFLLLFCIVRGHILAL